GKGTHEEVEALLVDGKKEEAVDASIRAGLWGLALLVASQCPAPTAAITGVTAGGEGEDAGPPPQPPYQRVVRLYANAFLHTGTPLHTMALAFSGQAGAAIKHGGKSLGGRLGGGGEAGQSGGFEESWMVTAAAVVSNKVPGWIEQLTGLGDRLLESNDVPAAHALFLVAGMQVELPTTKGSKLVLPGVDHRKPAHRALRTTEATNAVHILEVLDLAFKSGGDRVRNSAVQGHKLRLAMRLADLGFLQKAHDYARSVQEEVAAMSGRSQGGLEQRSPYSPQFIKALTEFEDRTSAALGLEGTAGQGSRADADGDRKRERSGAGSAAAGAGGVSNLVKTSATPGPAPTPSRSSSSASLNQGQTAAQHQNQNQNASSYGAPQGPSGGAAAARPARQQLAAPRPVQHAPGTAGSPFQRQQKQHHPSMSTRDAGSPPPGQGGGRGSSPSPPRAAGRSPPPPRHPAGGAGWPKAVASDTSVSPEGGQQGAMQSPPRSGAPGLGTQPFPQGAGVRAAFGNSPPRSTGGSPPAFSGGGAPPGGSRNSPLQDAAGGSSQKDGPASPGAGSAAVARRLLNRGAGEEGGRSPAKGVPHANSAPALVGERRGGNEEAVEQAPKSEPRKGEKGKEIQRRASVGGAAAVGAKPGRLAKMMTKWFYPEAK
ncbi:unnamed protein product, partial [Scytosiphon promiscuus]